MKVKRILLFFIILLILLVLMMVVLSQKSSDTSLDLTQINDIVRTIEKRWPKLQKGGELPSFGYRLDYAIINREGNLVAATRDGLNNNLNAAIQNRDTIVDIKLAGAVVGKVIFYNDTAQIARQNKTSLIYTFILLFVIMGFYFAGYTFYLYLTLLRPFHKLKGYAGQIAAGNLEIPIDMDKDNLFGAFTESFDIMREELHKARENERQADQSKKELVASLSHDIKTPIASIQAVTELMIATVPDKESIRQLETINAKAEQINSLITNMFHATLKELQALRVTVAEEHSTDLSRLIHNADYKGLVRPFAIPNCIILVDLQRLQQVFDNIISNSYKYANTDIEISAAFEEQYLRINMIDFGAGVAPEELPFLCKKFYRGKAADAESGYGLGLYISKYFLQHMSGNIECENHPGGFAVRLSLKLA